MLTLALSLLLAATPAVQQLQSPQLQSETSRRIPRDTLIERTKAMLAAGKLEEAREYAEALQDRDPNDAAALILLARVHLAWPVVGRFEAESLLRRAAEIRPGDPEPLYYLGLVGQALGSDDGESMARDGMLPVLSMNPDYRDTWTRWMTLYRGGGERRAVIRALESHAGNWDADYWRGEMLVELSRYNDADSVLRSVSARRPDDPGPLAWLARELFASGRPGEASVVYDRAVERAAADTGSVLWRQVRGIASPAERETWIRTPAEQRPAFFRRFWASRNPDLAASINPRLMEHFQRLADATRMYALLHPASRYFHSRAFRSLVDYRGTFHDEFDSAVSHASDMQCTAHPFGARDTALLAGLAPPRLNRSDTLPNLEDGLDDRGMIYLRHGKPNYRIVGSLSDETWCYVNPDGSTFQVTFVGRHGYMEVTPLHRGEMAAANLLLSTDESSIPVSLSFTFWPATFRGADRQHTELMIMPDSMFGIVELLDGEGNIVARDTATGRPLRLFAPAGRYLMLLNGHVGNRQGRYRSNVLLPDYGGDEPAISGMLLASGRVPPERDSLAQSAPPGLILPANQPLRVYAELYNMSRRDSTTRYTAEYQFERLDGYIQKRGHQRSTTIAFPREVPFTPRISESLVIDPGRLPAGHYRMLLKVTDELRNIATTSALIEFRLR